MKGKFYQVFFMELSSDHQPPLISAIVTFHSEGLIAHQTLLGLERLRRFADNQGVGVELVTVLDAADAETVRVVSSSPVLRQYDRIIQASNRDPGLSRNLGIQKAKGRFIGIFDGDDYYTENWLIEAMKTVQAKTGDVTVHPEYQITFGSDFCIARSIDMDEQQNYPMANCLSIHPWTACSFGMREMYLKHPYHPADVRQTGFGYEDWHWNLEMVANGFRHVVAHKTAHFYRRKPASRLTNDISCNAIIPVTTFFDNPEIWINKTVEPEVPDSNGKRKNRFGEKVVQLIRNKIWKQREFSEQISVIPEWAVVELRSISQIEPDLFPTHDFINRFRRYEPPLETIPGEVYAECCSMISDYNPDVIILVPWLMRGGADLGVLHHVNAALSVGKNVLVIATLNANSPWKERLPQKARFIEIGTIGSQLSEEQRLRVLTRLVLQSSARIIHVINSQLGWEMIKKYGKSLLAVEKTIFASAFCDDFDNNNVRWSYPRFYLPDCWPYLKGLMCDSVFYPGELKLQFGISTEKVHTLYFPTFIPEEHQYRSASNQRVLWAGRLTRQKRPDLLIGVARQLPDVSFDVYGYTYDHQDKKYEQELNELPNVRLHGSYDSFGEIIKSNDYSLFFYTSSWDGLPNVVLEAVAHGLPVVASAVCGIPEFINERTGYPVEDVAEPQAYALRIVEALGNVTERHHRWKNAFDLLQSRHSSTDFVQNLSMIDGYF